jgi:hypothetical protein
MLIDNQHGVKYQKAHTFNNISACIGIWITDTVLMHISCNNGRCETNRNCTKLQTKYNKRGKAHFTLKKKLKHVLFEFLKFYEAIN